MQDLCTLLVGALHYRFAWIGLKREGDRVVFPAAQAGNGQEYLETVTITWDESPTGLGPMGSAIRENRAHVVVDTRATDERFEPWRGEAVPRGYLSIIGLPMRTGGEVVGGLAVYADAPGAFSGDEIELLQGVADDLAHGLGRLRAEQLNSQRLHQLDILRAMTQDMISLRDLPRFRSVCCSERSNSSTAVRAGCICATRSAGYSGAPPPSACRSTSLGWSCRMETGQRGARPRPDTG